MSFPSQSSRGRTPTHRVVWSLYPRNHHYHSIPTNVKTSCNTQILLDCLHAELNRVKERPKYEELTDRLGESMHDAAKRSWDYWQKYENSLVHDIFGGQLVSQTRCSCGHCSLGFQFFVTLQLTPEKNLAESLRKYTEPQKLDDYTCASCGKNGGLVRTLGIYRLPRVLVVHLQRSSSESGEKLQTFVRFPRNNLDLSEFVRSTGEAPRYDLVAVTDHLTPSSVRRKCHGCQFLMKTETFVTLPT